jgi:hypothetical protein
MRSIPGTITEYPGHFLPPRRAWVYRGERAIFRIPTGDAEIVDRITDMIDRQLAVEESQATHLGNVTIYAVAVRYTTSVNEIETALDHIAVNNLINHIEMEVI